MKKKGFVPELIITMLREEEVLLSQGSAAVEVVKKLGITDQTYYRWGKEYGGMRIEQAIPVSDVRSRLYWFFIFSAMLSIPN